MHKILLFLFQTTTATDPTDIGPVIAVITTRSLMLTTLVNPIVNALAKAWLGLSGPKIPFIAMGVAGVLDALFMLVIGQPFNGKSFGMLALTALATGFGSKIIADNNSKQE